MPKDNKIDDYINGTTLLNTLNDDEKDACEGEITMQ